MELIPTVKIETGHPVEGSFGNEFPSICNYSHLISYRPIHLLKLDRTRVVKLPVMYVGGKLPVTYR